MDETAAGDSALRVSFFDKVATGEIALDGVMSERTLALKALHQANDVSMKRAWACTPQTWECPACGRAKADIVRLNHKGQLMCVLVEHHDHMQDLLKKEFEQECYRQKCSPENEEAKQFTARAKKLISAFDNIIICEDCNVADGESKTVAGAATWFSYSPQEIRQFVRPQPNRKHDIDKELAQQIWKQQAGTYARRLKTVERVVGVAAADLHWYQAFPQAQTADELYRSASNLALKHYGDDSVLDELSGTKNRRAEEDPSRWRKMVRPKIRQYPSRDDIDYVAQLTSNKLWNSVADDWYCNVCRRTKHQIIRPTKKNDWNFLICTDQRTGKRICSECHEVASMLRKEACRKAKLEPDCRNDAQYIQASELEPIIRAQAHGRHNIDNDLADQLVERLADRFLVLGGSRAPLVQLSLLNSPTDPDD